MQADRFLRSRSWAVENSVILLTVKTDEDLALCYTLGFCLMSSTSSHLAEFASWDHHFQNGHFASIHYTLRITSWVLIINDFEKKITFVLSYCNSVENKEVCSSFSSFHYFALQRCTCLSDLNHWNFFVSLIRENFIKTCINLSISNRKTKQKKRLHVHYYSQHIFAKLLHNAMHDGTIELEITFTETMRTCNSWWCTADPSFKQLIMYSLSTIFWLFLQDKWTSKHSEIWISLCKYP